MRAVMPVVPPDLLAHRKRTGADAWDEMWNGVLHMAPSPNLNHQDFAAELEAWLRTYWTRPRRARVFHDCNLAPAGGWSHDYRIPDLILITPDRLGGMRGDYFEGPPAVVVEIRSPGDESYEKLPFYAQLGVPEVWIIDRDTKQPELHRLGPQGYLLHPADDAGWLHSAAVGVSFRAGGNEKLAIQLAGEPETCRLLPE
jgi:Uma2 family endonuclease